MILFHGTQNENEIIRDGFLVGQSKHALASEGGVYFSDTYEYAEQHGSVIEVEISDEYVELYQENPLAEGDYGYIPGDEYFVSVENLDKVKII